ncbi:PEP-CTERM sorting domain-containing protein [Armatimonas sp.]|uniref:PEP-CTERM sorting domain-containing protein n=1 Tax=Armatimonas sp. TaxID=1872638 RepID=UPI00286D18A6|nr:PEP-CTERM sorting domain-containing protein [Armatimonas sp.]
MKNLNLPLTLALLALPSLALAQTVVSGTGANPAALTPFRDQFRTNLGGGTTAGANGSFGGLRREINWDGVPAAFSAPNNLPANFFNANSPRGAVFSTSGTGFQVSSATTDAGAGQPVAARFGNIEANYTSTFQTFSAQRLFSAIGSNVYDVDFFVPGTTTPALVSGFGSIFTDVDLLDSTSIEYFDQNNVSLGTFSAPVQDLGLSFIGVSFASPTIAKVRITQGNIALGAGINDEGSSIDVVAADDFLYSEPVSASAPEPGTLALLALGGTLTLIRCRRRVAAQ